MNGPAPNLVSDYIGWDTVLIFAAIVALAELARFAYRWCAESRRLDDVLDAMDEQSRRSIQRGKWL